MAPTFQAAGTAQTSTGATVSVAWPTHLINDIGLVVIETSGNSATLTPPSGWVAIPGTPVTDVATTAGSKLHVWWKRAASAAEGTVATGAATDHIVARLYTFRNVTTIGNPWNVITTGTKTTASTTATIPTLTTTNDDTLITMVCGRPDDSASTTHFGVPVNANLTGLAEAGEAGTTSGNGGGFVVSYGTDATAGSTGTSTMTKAASTTDTYVVLALKQAYTLDGTTQTYTYTGTSTGLLENSVLFATQQTYTYSGTTTGLLETSVIFATKQTYTYTGTTTGLLRSALLDATTTTYDVVGISANLDRYIPFNLTPTSYSIQGISSDLNRSYSLNHTVGSFNVVGSQLTLDRPLFLELNTATYTVAGIDSNLLNNKTLNLIPTSLSMRLQSNGDFFWYRTTQTIPIVKPVFTNRNQWVLGRATHMGQRRL
jgi:hypothetical protein